MPSISVDMESLSHYPDVGVAIAWIVAGQDLSMTTYLQNLIKADPTASARKELQDGAFFYAARLYVAQTNEALRLLEPSQKSQSIMALIESESKAKTAFARLIAIKADETHPAKILLEDVRNKATFHYYDYYKSQQKIPGWLQAGLAAEVRLGISTADTIVYEDGMFRCGFADKAFQGMFNHNIIGIPEFTTNDLNSPEAKAADAKMTESVKIMMKVADDVVTIAFHLIQVLSKRFRAK